jgi:serine/threonine protein kinase
MAADATGGIGVGTIVADSYEVTGLLGRGGMGAVWVAQHRRLPGKRVAIKVLLAGVADPQSLARFQREAEIASRIGHPNIVDVLDFNTLADGTPYQVLEFLEGESLGARLKRGPLPLAGALELARQMGSALLAAHRAGVVHRDLKPENIILCPSDSGGVLHERVKVLDFGISKIRGSHTLQTQESVLIGTPQYMSPEQAKGKNQQVDQRSDIFALGAIVYEMLSGRTAFGGDSVVSVILDVVQGTPTPLAELVPSLPPAVVAAVDRALAKAPADRFEDVGAFIGALTGRPLDTLGDARAAATPAPDTGRPLSAEEILGATQASSPGLASHGPPPTTVTATSERGRASAAAAAHGRRSPVLWLAAAAGVLALVAGAWAWVRRPVATEREIVAAAGVEAAQPAGVETAGAAAAPATGAETTGSTETSGTPAIPDAAAAGTRARPQTAARSTRAQAQTPEPDDTAGEPLPPAVAAQLSEAERLLEQGDPREAIRRARQSFFVRKSNRGWALLTRAFCRQGDLENARASFRNIRRGSPERLRAARACRAASIDLR